MNIDLDTALRADPTNYKMFIFELSRLLTIEMISQADYQWSWQYIDTCSGASQTFCPGGLGFEVSNFYRISNGFYRVAIGVNNFNDCIIKYWYFYICNGEYDEFSMSEFIKVMENKRKKYLLDKDLATMAKIDLRHYTANEPDFYGIQLGYVPQPNQSVSLAPANNSLFSLNTRRSNE